jgi:hypothetical protein
MQVYLFRGNLEGNEKPCRKFIWQWSDSAIAAARCLSYQSLSWKGL